MNDDGTPITTRDALIGFLILVLIGLIFWIANWFENKRRDRVDWWNDHHHRED